MPGRWSDQNTSWWAPRMNCSAVGLVPVVRVTDDPATLQLVTAHRTDVEALLGVDAFERAAAEGAGMSAAQALAHAR